LTLGVARVVLLASRRRFEMAIHESVEIARPPDEVFSYATDPARLTEWQDKLLEANMETEGPVGVGSRMTQKRDVGLGTRTFTAEVTAYEPPRLFAFRGVDGPIRPEGKVTFEPLDDGKRTRYTIDMDFKGHGLGVLLLPLVRRDAGKEIPHSLTHLKQKLDGR
jgi:uncharacterized protein YndB with AHSA1/START domain